MDPPKQQQQSTNSPPLLQPSSPQESSSEIQDSEFHTWFQEIFPGRQLPASFQPEQTSVPRKDSSLPHPHLQSLPRSNPLPWHDSPERLLLRELYPHLDSQCTTGSASDSRQRNRVLATRPPRPPRPRRESQEENVLAPRPPRPRREEDNVLAPPPRQPLAQAEEEPVRSSPPASKCSTQCWFMFAVIFFVGFIICALVLVYLVIIYTLH
ncbi:hypothetical protein QL285_076339 [Trifolium repens]|nr:hypothetical protein QL285_076339 [Trifolium repens]